MNKRRRTLATLAVAVPLFYLLSLGPVFLVFQETTYSVFEMAASETAEFVYWPALCEKSDFNRPGAFFSARSNTKRL